MVFSRNEVKRVLAPFPACSVLMTHGKNFCFIHCRKGAAIKALQFADHSLQISPPSSYCTLETNAKLGVLCLLLNIWFHPQCLLCKISIRREIIEWLLNCFWYSLIFFISASLFGCWNIKLWSASSLPDPKGEVCKVTVLKHSTFPLWLVCLWWLDQILIPAVVKSTGAKTLEDGMLV